MAPTVVLECCRNPLGHAWKSILRQFGVAFIHLALTVVVAAEDIVAQSSCLSGKRLQLQILRNRHGFRYCLLFPTAIKCCQNLIRCSASTAVSLSAAHTWSSACSWKTASFCFLCRTQRQLSSEAWLADPYWWGFSGSQAQYHSLTEPRLDYLWIGRGAGCKVIFAV